MSNIFKTLSFLLIATLFVLNYSCLTKEEESRTSAIEQAELNELLSNILAEGLDIDTTELGLYYILHAEGSGPYPEPGDTLSMEYAGYLADGNLFDASEDFSFVFKETSLISGFEDGIALMNEGTELEMIIPSALGYGATGTPSIPPYSTLIFVTKMNEIKPVL